MTSGLNLRSLQPEGEAKGAPETLIIAVYAAADGPERAERFASQWQPMVPGVQFLGLELADMLWRVDVSSVQRIVAEAAALRGLGPAQILLLGLGEGGRLAVELVVTGVLPVLGVIAYDIPLPNADLPRHRSAAAVRLIQQNTPDDPGNTRFRALTRDLQRQGMDVRAILLPEGSLWSHDMPMRAGTAFLLELVARASLIPPR